ncbi:MAG: hypothetical protein AVDCRST_MAG27-2539 [uncultured Craurococcus sp.]|uniref:Uncharacterized protein n=1 Tax=uncultured Craurococcus sp. TaxID=1135998 RepID=A0A6J4IV60_9PROT|nr:MAG: hypothetical protein AVDCRST_MAG27-2539 [uncultured Craurococcus sp.]
MHLTATRHKILSSGSHHNTRWGVRFQHRLIQASRHCSYSVHG